MIVVGDVDRVANESGCRNGGVSVCSDSGWDGNGDEGGGGCDCVESGEVVMMMVVVASVMVFVLAEVLMLM